MNDEKEFWDKVLSIKTPKGTFKCPKCLTPLIFESAPVLENMRLVGFSISFLCDPCEIELELGNETRFSSGIQIQFGNEQ